MRPLPAIWLKHHAEVQGYLSVHHLGMENTIFDLHM